MRCASLLLVLCAVCPVYTLTDRDKTTLLADSQVTISVSGSYYIVSADGVPPHATGDFPTSYNPNSIATKNYQFYINSNPTHTANSQYEGCLPLGPIGMARNGVPLFNPLSFEDANAVEGDGAEIFDLCEGHPDQQGSYHYHQISTCIPQWDDVDTLIGIALDGFPIYSSKTAGGVTLTSDDLDDCHGRIETDTDGNSGYRYRLTKECPYILGCFRSSLHSSFAGMVNNNKCKTVTASSTYCTTGSGAGAVYLSGGLVLLLAIASLL